MADAAGLNSFVRQIGGSVGLTIFATLFTNYAIEARGALAAHLTELRPEVHAQFQALLQGAFARGADLMSAPKMGGAAVARSMFAQATVLSFDRVFLFQGLLFLGVLPLLFLIRVPRTAAPAHVEMPVE